MCVKDGRYMGKYGFSEVYPIFVKRIGEKRANTLVECFKRVGCFVVPSDDVSKGKFLIVSGTSRFCKGYYKTVTDLKNEAIRLVKKNVADGFMTSYQGHQLINNLATESKKRKVPQYYTYRGTIEDSSLVQSDFIGGLGKDKASMLMWALDKMAYFVAPSDDIKKGRYIIVDKDTLKYSNEDYLKTVEDVRKEVITLVKGYIKEGYIDKSRGEDILIRL